MKNYKEFLKDQLNFWSGLDTDTSIFAELKPSVNKIVESYKESLERYNEVMK